MEVSALQGVYFGRVDCKISYLYDLPEAVLVLGEAAAVLLEVTVGTEGREGPRGTEGPRGMVGPSGTGRLTAALVKVEVPATLVIVGVARLSNLDVNGSWKKKYRLMQLIIHVFSVKNILTIKYICCRLKRILGKMDFLLFQFY